MTTITLVALAMLGARNMFRKGFVDREHRANRALGATFPRKGQERGRDARRLGRLLLDAGAISEEDLLRGLEKQEKSGGRLDEILLAYGMLDVKNLTSVRAADLGVPTVGAGDRPIPLLPAEEARKRRAVALMEMETDKGRPLSVAFADPTPEDVEAVRKLLRRPIRPKLADEDTITMLLTELYGEEEVREVVAALAREHPELSAEQNRLSLPQAVVLGIVVFLLLIGLIFVPLITAVAAIGVGTLFYVLYAVFRMNATYQGWKDEKAFRPSREDLDGLDERELPVYTILLPVYGEKPQTLRVLIEALSDLEYPKQKLYGLLLVEEDDDETQEAIREAGRPPWLKVLYVPAGGPRTKPKAMAYGLLYAKGEMLTVYDAEDKPEPYQLKEAIWLFRKLDDPDVACLQAKLNYYNPRQNLLTRWFTLEYSAWFDLFLPGLHRMGAPIPLGGTSNHFKTDALRDAMNWDPYNVAEDADLGLRLFRTGKKIAMLHSTTYEEANSQWRNWMRQRSRWIKGYIQTFFVHTRHPWTLYKEIGLKNCLIFVATIGGLIFTVLVSPIFWVLTLLWVIAQPGFIVPLFPGPVYYPALASLFIGNFFFVFLGLMGAVEKGADDLAPHTLLTPVYWFLMSVAGYRALYEFIFHTHHWHKTEHGLHFEEEEHEIALSRKGG
jgi:cellulose synthase/poly-beta-1,6-N-acetylglucosamine synthase-like glycosyltransferase